MEIYSEGINASCRLPEPIPKFHNIYGMQCKFEDHDISLFFFFFPTNFRTLSPKAGPVHQVHANPEEDPKEDPDEDPKEDPNENPDEDPNKDPVEYPGEDSNWDLEEDSNIDPRDVMVEDPDYNPRRDWLSE